MKFFSKKEVDTDINVIEPKEIEVDIKEKETLTVSELLEMCLNHFIVTKPQTIGLVSRGQKSKESLNNELKTFLQGNEVSEETLQKVQTEFDKYIWGYGKLDDLINNNDDVSDIKILSYDNIRIKKLGKRMTSDVKFSSKDEVRRFVEFVAIKNGSTLAEINALQKFTDKTTSEKFILRINIATEYVNSIETPYLHIRKIAKNKLDMKKLIELGFCTEEEAEYLLNAVKKGLSIIFTGKGGSGKTTLMNALLDEIPHDKSGLVIQEAEELFSNTHPDMMFQTVRYSKGESKIQYTLKDLAINGLLTDLDCFVIGEIKGEEALYFLNASYTGHICWGGVHGNNSKEALNKLADYMKYASDYSKDELLSMLKDIDLVIFMKNFGIREMSEISGYDEINKKVQYNKIFENSKRISSSCEKVLNKLNS
ncbi:MAG: ATPase, T2SS/T4P/T4SS family [Clostridium celatum]|nr:ATPase, T2SS/T4P/T4SS family [Clostridium celatum]